MRWKTIILKFDDKQNRINNDDLEEIASSIVNYLGHDWDNFFEISFDLDKDYNEVELPAIEIDYDILDDGVL